MTPDETEKDLLCEVLDLTVIDVLTDKDSMYEYFDVEHEDSGSYIVVTLNAGYKAINIYELAHKCKEWAWKNEFLIRSKSTFGSGFESGYCEIEHIHKGWTEEFFAKKNENIMSEPEAILEACHWILKNKRKYNV
jgi:hypothetical protein